ncbi:MAG TPA: zf-HC2 domain-containing protein [Thermoanaerobaculia bacterium]
MLCKEVKRVVYFFLDGTLDAKHKRDFTKHLKLCPECESRITISRRIRIFIKKRLARMSAPARLKQRLTRSLRAFAE